MAIIKGISKVNKDLIEIDAYEFLKEFTDIGEEVIDIFNNKMFYYDPSCRSFMTTGMRYINELTSCFTLIAMGHYMEIELLVDALFPGKEFKDVSAEELLDKIRFVNREFDNACYNFISCLDKEVGNK